MRNIGITLFLLFIYVTLLTPVNIHAKPICQIQHFSVYNGLAQRTVTAIVQDPKGFIWFSTWNGLNKFDGYTFKNYKAYPGDGCTLTSNRLSGIVANQHCGIWCQTYDKRVFLFDSRKEKFIDILQPLEKENRTIYTVHKVYALDKGVSWIVFDNGAFRVDESSFKEGDRNSPSITLYSPTVGNLPDGTISNIRQDADGDEWIFTDKGASVVGKKKETITISFKIKSSSENNEKMYFISANNQLAVYNFKTGQSQFKRIPYPYSQLNLVKSLGKDTIGIGTNGGVILFFAHEGKFKYVDLHMKQSSPNIIRIFKDCHNELWLFSKEPGVMRYNIETEEKQYYQTPQQDMPKAERQSRDIFFEDNQGTTWIVPHSGCLSYYDREDKQLKPYYSDYNNPETKFSPVILNSFLDKQRNFWFANTSEMNKISFFPNAWQLKLFDKGFETRAFLIDSDQNFWAANKKGFIRIFNPDQSLKGYLTPEGYISSKAIPFSKNIYCFMEDEQGDVWLGTKWDGIYCLKKKSNGHFHIQRYVYKENDPYSLSNNSIYSIYQDKQKRIWIGTYGGGLNLLQKEPNGKVRFLHSKNSLKGFPINKFLKIRTIKEIGQTILVGTTEGLLTFSCNFKRPEDIKFHQNIREPNVATSLSSNDVTCIYTDSKQNSYVLTFTGGINQIVSNNLLTNHIQFKTYTKREGLSSDLVLSMIEDHQKKLWIISENALTKFNFQNGTFENYDIKYLQKETYFSEAMPILQQNQLILGTDDGILRINPTALSKSSYTPSIAFTGLRIQGIQQNLNIDDLTVLNLKPHKRNISVEFAALDYVDPSSINYAYRLKGMEKSWNEDNSRKASYINLPPGEYKLQIRSTNSDGVWTNNIRTLRIVVTPTFWETYWAILFYILLIILFTTIIVYIILYIYKLRHQINIEQQLADVKLRFFTDISHELRTPLTLITSPISEVLEHEKLSANARKYLNIVHKNTDRMLRLVNQILDFRKIENNKMKLLLEKTEVIDLLKRVMDNFRLIAEEKNINYHLQTDQACIYAWIDRDKFEKVIFNLISNAFKYTPINKAITVSVNIKENKLVISVIDEGMGIDPQKRQTLFQRFETLVQSNILKPSSGIGLSLVNELIELHQGNIQVNSQIGIGSEFIVTLPLEQEAYEKNGNVEFILNDSLTTVTKQNKDKKNSAHKEETTPEDAKVCDKDTNKEQISILIVEDNLELRTFLNDILIETYKITQAMNGQEGLEYANQYMPDLIISDIMMPIMDGLDMVKAIKENRDTCHIPIILLSAKSSLDDRIKGLEQGIDDYITKPFSSTYLKIRIKSLLHQRKLLQELYFKQWTEKQKESPSSIDIEPTQPHITPFDEQFMTQVMEIMDKQMDNSDLTIDEFAQLLGMGRTVFYQKLKSIIGLSPVDFIREMRIKRARQLIESGEYNISSIAYMTGFNDPKYFSKCFKKKYGVSPSEYKSSPQ